MKQFASHIVVPMTQVLDAFKAPLAKIRDWKLIVEDDYFLTEMAAEVLANHHAETLKPHYSIRLSPKLIPDRYAEEVLETPKGRRTNRKQISACFIFASKILVDVYRILGNRTDFVPSELNNYIVNSLATLRVKWSGKDIDYKGEIVDSESTKMVF